LVYPAHDYKGDTASTIGYELYNNPRLQVENAEQYADIMNNLNLADPKMMDIAVPANKALGKSIYKFVRSGESLSAEELCEQCSSGELIMIDLREKQERLRDGWIPRSLHIPYADIEEQAKSGGILDQIIIDHPNCVILYCAYGERSAMALDTVRDAGYTGLRHLAGGMAAWSKSGGEIVFN
ncbi:MAG: rhodanese-like domain-containing protein, partial [Desulfobulbia bacterium]